MTKTLRTLCNKITAWGVALIATGMLLPPVPVSAYDQTEASEMLESGSIFYYEPESEPDLVSSVFFTKVGDNEDVIVKDKLEANTLYTLHLVIQNRSHDNIREAALYAPLVAEPVKMNAVSTDESNLLSFTLTGRMPGNGEDPEKGVKYLHALDLSSSDGSPLELSYIPNTARCYSVTYLGEEREAMLSDVELASEGIGAFVSSEIERYGSEEDPKYRIDNFGIESSSRLCEVRMTVQTSEGKQGTSIGNTMIVSVVSAIVAVAIFAVIATIVSYFRNRKFGRNNNIDR